MNTTTTLRPEEKRTVRAFGDFIYNVRVDGTFTLRNLQGGLRFNNPRVPATQKYTEHLRVAIEEGWIEPVGGQPETYRRLRYKNQSRQKSAYMRGELQSLKDKLVCILGGGTWID